MDEIYNKHYIITDAQGVITDGWSDGPFPDKNPTGAICINERGGYQFRLVPEGEENPGLRDMYGVPLYKYKNGEVKLRTEKELDKDRASIQAEKSTINPSQTDITTLLLMQAQALPKEQALKVKSLYPEWRPGDSYAMGQIVLIKHGGVLGDRLYKARQSHTAQEDWKPPIVPSLWESLDEDHQGTMEDPIPAMENMTYYQGKYYLEGDKLYLCTRDSEIPLAYTPSQLVGHYFEEVS